MRTSNALLLAALLTAAGFDQADAQTITSPYDFIEKKKDLGLFVGYLFADRGSLGLGPYEGPLAGAKFTLGLSGPMNLGAYVSYFPSERDVVDLVQGGTVLGKTSMNLLLITGQLKLQLTGPRTWNNLAPYFYLGLGVAFDVSSPPSCFDEPGQPNCRLPAQERFSFGTAFMGQVGFGTIWLPFERIGFRATVDDSIWELSSPGGLGDEWTNNIQVTFGAYYWF